MIIYLDESYDTTQDYFVLGSLFNPHHKALLKEIKNIKTLKGFLDSNGLFKEIKYSECYCKKHYEIATLMIDAFLKSTSYFRAIVVEKSKLNLNKFGNIFESKKIKWARAYKKFAEMLIRYNSFGIYNGVLLTDKLSHCDGDCYIAKMKEEFCFPTKFDENGNYVPTLKYIDEIDSKLEAYQVMQLNDILLGCIINNLKPCENKWKNKLREYLTNSLDVPNLLSNSWNPYTKAALDKLFPKYNIWYWKTIKK